MTGGHCLNQINILKEVVCCYFFVSFYLNLSLCNQMLTGC